MSKDIRIRATLFCAAAVGALASPALAQDAPGAAPTQDQAAQDQADEGGSALSGDIIVTAQRR